MNKILELLFCAVSVLIIYGFAVNAKSACQNVIQYELSASRLSTLEFKHSWIFWQAQNKGEQSFIYYYY